MRRPMTLPLKSCIMALSTALVACLAAAQPAAPREVKVLIVSMFGPEARPWVEPLTLTQEIAVPGLSAEYPMLRCNDQGVCLMTTGMGHANAAASITAVMLSNQFDFRKAYVLVSGIAGIDPKFGTTGTAAWARYVVSFGVAHEIDAREMPTGWNTGLLGIMTKAPGEKPKFAYNVESVRLNEALLQKALALSRNAKLDDNDKARAYRANYKAAPANEAPRVTQCDSLSGDTWWHGDLLGKAASEWVKTLTDGLGTYCTTQQEDSATLNALARAAAAGKFDLQRVAVLRSASNFDRPYPGQSAYESLMASTNGASGGFVPALRNLYAAGGPLVADIVSHWNVWAGGVPPP